jgi:hypothetical protein
VALVLSTDPTAAEVVAVSDSDVAFLVDPSVTTAAAVKMTHANLVAAMACVVDDRK